MREILFRGKRLDNGEWVEGFYIGKTDPLLEVSYHYIVAQHGKDSFVTWHLVAPDTVGQYTGLTANGKRIFEGDVVRDSCGCLYLVAYGRHDLACCGCCFQSHEAVGFYLKRDGFALSDDLAWHDILIIGNIHDNPELLQGV